MVRPVLFAGAVFFLAGPPVAAQVAIELTAGPTFPVGTYGITQTGWMVRGHLEVPVQRGLSALVGGFYDANRYRQPDYIDPSTGKPIDYLFKLSGPAVGLLYRPGNPDRPGLFVFWEGAWLTRTGSGSSDKRIGYFGGAGVAVPLSRRVDLRVTGSYFATLFDTDNSVVGILAGGRIGLSGGRIEAR